MIAALPIALLLASALTLAGPESTKLRPADALAELRILADQRLEAPLRAIAEQYARRSDTAPRLDFRTAEEVDRLAAAAGGRWDVVLCMSWQAAKRPAVAALPGARKVAWKYPGFAPVWAAALVEASNATQFVRFTAGPTGHRIWSEAETGFTIVPDQSAEAYAWVVENRLKHTYPMTAMRMLAECGGIRSGVCLDIGCGTGQLDVELAKRSQLTVIGLDINPAMQPLFEKTVRQAGLEGRVRFVCGDAQQLPFPDDSADLIVSRGTLIFLPDIAQCLREVQRVLKPTGVAFLGGRYLYAPQKFKISSEKLKEIVRRSGISGASVIEGRGQWVKILGPQAPAAAHQFHGGPHMLAGRLVVDYGITRGDCLLLCSHDGPLQQALQRGLVEMTEMRLTALYPSPQLAEQAAARIRAAGLAERIACRAGQLSALPFAEGRFDLIAGVGPVLIFQKDKPQAMCEIYRVLRPGGAALVGGRYLGMPEGRKISSEALRHIAARSGIRPIRVIDEMGQWVEIRKGIGDWELAD